MQKRKFYEKVIVYLMIFAMVFTMIPSNYVQAASSKTVKTITVKNGSKSVAKKTITLKKGKTATLKVTVKPSSAKKKITYKSNKSSVASVNSKGKITAKKAGTAKITITVLDKSKKKKTSWVNVKVTGTTPQITPQSTPQTVNVTSVTLTAASQLIKVGETTRVSAVVVPENASNKSLSFSSSNPAVLTVDQSGNVQGTGAGAATVTATAANGVSGSVNISVQEAVVPVAGVALTAGSNNIKVGESTRVSAVVIPENATNKSLAFSSSNAAVLTVDQNGNVQGTGAGTATVTAMAVNGVSGSVTITVEEPRVEITGIHISAEASSINIGEETEVHTVIEPENATDQTVSYSSSNLDILTVDENGTVKGIGVGTATVTVTASNGMTDTIDISVTAEVTEVTISISSTEMSKGTVGKVTAVVTPDNAVDKTLTFASSKPEVVSIDEYGGVTARDVGTATITATAVNGVVSNSLEITVKSVGVTGIELNTKETTVPVNGTTTLRATVLPENATNRQVIWSSSDEKTAKVDANGVVTGMAVGTANIVAKTEDGGITDTCVVTVVDNTSNLADGLSITVANRLEDYSNTEKSQFTVLTGTNAQVQVRLIKDGKPVGNQEVRLTKSYLFGNGYDNNDEIFGILDAASTKTTNADGYATFTVGLKDGYDNFKPTDEKYQSMKLTATYGSVSTEAALSFACIKLQDMRVVNLENIEPSENAVAGDNGIAETKSTNGNIIEEYVKSQQVSASTANHEVIFSVAPCLWQPALTSSIGTGEYTKEINVSSGEYSVYNDETNKTTTTLIEEIPAGLAYASLNFESLILSKYTKLKIAVYDSKTGTLVEDDERANPYVLDDTNLTGTTLTYQIPKLKNDSAYIVVSLISEGQVNDDMNAGYTIADITGEWGSVEILPYTATEIADSVSWEIVKARQSEAQKMDYETAKRYIPEGDYLRADYTYTYTVPSFPNTGNATITVWDSNKTEKAYYQYPAVNQKDSDGNYTNKNDIAEPTTIPKAILIGSKEKNDDVGELTTDGNYAIVNSEYTGYTGLKATISLDALTSQDGTLTGLTGGTVYTSVQWAPIPVKEEVEQSDDFYALAGQNVTITAYLYDADGKNRVTTAGKDVVFYTQDGEMIGSKDSSIGATHTTVISNAGKTDTNGMTMLKLKSSYAEDVTGIYAKSGSYIVKLTIGTEQKEVSRASIHWVKAGLSFTEEVGAEATEAYEYTDASQSVKLTSREVNGNWIFGYQVIGKLADLNAYKVSEISDIKVNITRTGVGTQDDTGCGNGEIRLTSTVTGDSTLTGTIGSKSAGDAVKFTIVDEDGELIGTYNNVGEGDPAIEASLPVAITWAPKGMKAFFVIPQGATLDKSMETDVYVKIEDENHNPIVNSQKVEYTISSTDISGFTTISKTSDSDANGLVKIHLDAPAQKGKVLLTATVAGNDITERTITYMDTGATEFAMVNAQVIPSGSTEKDQIALTFSNPLNKETINKNLFTVSAGTQKYEIEKAELSTIDGDDGKVVILTMVDSSIHNAQSDVTVSVKPYVESGISYSLMDTKRFSTLKEGYQEVITSPSNSCKIEAKYDSANQKITVKLQDGKDEVTGALITPVIAVSDVGTVLGDGTGMVVLDNTDGAISVSPVEGQLINIWLYYKGASTKVQIGN